MAQTETPGLRVNRIEALSDGVFAIAMTLLVLELRVPEIEADPGLALPGALGAMWTKFASFILGFVLLGSLWVGQHFQLHYVRRVDRALLWLHLALLMVASWMPFNVALLGRYGATPLVCALYGGVLLLSGLLLLTTWTYATSQRRLVEPSLPEPIVRALRARILAGLFVYGLGFGLSFVEAKVSLALYASMPLLYVLPSGIDAKAKSEEPGDS